MLRMKHILLSLVLSALSVSGLAADRLNILFILADDMGFADAGCYGGEIATRPCPRSTPGHGRPGKHARDVRL